MNMGAEPCSYAGKVSFRNFLPEISAFLFHDAKHLRAIGAAKGIRREIADHAAGSVGILQTAFLIAGNRNAQIFLIKPVPSVWQIRNL